MKIVIITQGLSRIVRPLVQTHHAVVGIAECAPRTEQKPSPFRALIKPLLHSLAKNKYFPLRTYCRQQEIDYFYLTKNADAEFHAWVSSLKPDIIVVYSMSFLLNEAIISLPKHGAINLHSALLPAYRGPNPDFWHYHDMTPMTGVTVHYVDKHEDTGDIIAQDQVEIPLGMKSPDRLDLVIDKLGVRLLLQAIDDIAAGTAQRSQQPAKSPTARARNLKPDEHSSIINWQTWPSERVWHVLRGTELWLDALPKPSGLYSGHRWMVGAYQKIPNFSETPGQIGRDNDGFYVALKDGNIRLYVNFSLKTAIMRLVP